MNLKLHYIEKEIHERKQAKQDKNTRIRPSYRVQQSVIWEILGIFNIIRFYSR